MSCRPFAPLLVVMVCLLASPATAQDLPYTEAPAHIAFVDGTAVLERDGQIDRTPRSMPLLAGDRLRTEDGRLEVLFPDGSALHLDAGTVVDFQSDEVVRLLQGRIRLSLAGPARDVFYRIDAPSAWVEIGEAGEYRVAMLRDGGVELAVLRGSAELVNEQGRSHIRAGERTFAQAGAAPSAPYVFNSAAWDAFDQWSEERRSQRLGASAQYLPGDVRPYASTFDRYGTWRHEPVHGYVWYPRVASGWRPYHHGRWVSLRPYGWTWIAADPWGWPTHHYGRWGISAGVWYWIPGRQWGPAWVSWAYATDYVTWCPLGWNNRPVVQIVNINIGTRHRFSPWHAWTVVPRRHFSGSFVNVTAIGSARVDQRIHNTFIVRDRAPETRFAVGRDRAPIRAAGRFAVPRSGGGSVSASRAGDDGRRLNSPGRTGADGERRFPAPARTPGTVTSSQRGGTQAAPSTATGRAVSRGQASEVTGGAASRAARPSPPASAMSAPASRDGAAVRTRRAAPAGDSRRGAVTAPPAGAVRAVPRSESSTEAAPSRGAPARTRSYSSSPSRSAGQAAPESAGTRAVGAAPRTRSSSTESASPASPARGAAGPGPSSPARSRSYPATAAPPAASSPAAASPAGAPRPSGGIRSTPASRGAPPDSGNRTRAMPRSGSVPAAPAQAPAQRAAPERRTSTPPPAAAAPSSSRQTDRSSPRADAGSRQRSTDGASSGGRARRRE